MLHAHAQHAIVFNHTRSAVHAHGMVPMQIVNGTIAGDWQHSLEQAGLDNLNLAVADLIHWLGHVDVA